MLLQLDNVSRRFGGLVAVDSLNFGVNDEEILGVIGPNGAGKTTALNIISAFYPATSGQVVFGGVDITRLNSHEIVALGVGRTFQQSVLFMSLPVIENVYLAHHLSYRVPHWQRLLRLPSAKREEQAMRERAAEILEQMTLGAVQHELAKSLPHGQQRILGICLALATRPRLLLLDEPLTGMNAVETQEALELIRGIRDSGVTILVIEHNMGAVMSLCDRLVVMNEGRKIAEGVPSEIQLDPLVIKAYLGEEVEEDAAAEA